MHQCPPFTSISYRRANHCFQNVPRCHCSRLFGFEPRRRPPMTTIGHGTSLFSFGWFSNVSTRILQTKYKIRCTCTSETHILQVPLPLPGFSTLLKNKFASIGKKPSREFFFQQAIFLFFFFFAATL